MLIQLRKSCSGILLQLLKNEGSPSFNTPDAGISANLFYLSNTLHLIILCHQYAKSIPGNSKIKKIHKKGPHLVVAINANSHNLKMGSRCVIN